jgi:hypothetical protein
MEKPPNWKEMDAAEEARSQDVVARAVNRLGRMIDRMQLTHVEAELAFAYLLAESISYQPTKYEREFNRLAASRDYRRRRGGLRRRARGRKAKLNEIRLRAGFAGRQERER